MRIAAVDEMGGVGNFQAAHDVWNVSSMLSGMRKPSDEVLHSLGYRRKPTEYEKLKS